MANAVPAAATTALRSAHRSSRSAAILPTMTAAPITSAGRHSPLGPRGLCFVLLMPLQGRRKGVDPNKHVLFGCRQAAIRLYAVPLKKQVKLASG
jgi:hypothetical protein